MTFRIGCDLDGVIFEQLDIFLPYYQKFNSSIKNKEDITDYNPEKLGFPFSEFQNMLIHLEGNGIYRKINPIPGAIKSVNKFYEKLGAEIYCITARGSCLGYLDRNKILEDSWISLRKHKTNFIGLYHSSPKLDKIRELKISVMIEDNPEEIKLLSEGNIYCICVNRPYNNGVKENEFIKKCDPNKIFECFNDNYSNLFNTGK